MQHVFNTLFVGIDVFETSNQIYAMNFDQKKLLSFSSPNDTDGASKIESKLLEYLVKNDLQ